MALLKAFISKSQNRPSSCLVLHAPGQDSFIKRAKGGEGTLYSSKSRQSSLLEFPWSNLDFRITVGMTDTNPNHGRINIWALFTIR